MLRPRPFEFGGRWLNQNSHATLAIRLAIGAHMPTQNSHMEGPGKPWNFESPRNLCLHGSVTTPKIAHFYDLSNADELKFRFFIARGREEWKYGSWRFEKETETT